MYLNILLTQNTTPIFRYIVWILGKIMEGIFTLLDMVGIPNIGLSIIFFTLFVNICMLPLTYKQQKFSKLQMKMQPELKAIQDKYKGKRDQESAMAMNAETQAVYAKYGTSPTGSCAYLLIQMPILFALYRVIQNIPAYVTKVGNIFKILADKIIISDQAQFLRSSELESVKSALSMYKKNLDADLGKGVIDVLNKISTSDMAQIAEHYDLSGLKSVDGNMILSQIASDGSVVSKGLIDTYNSFLGMNIGNSPWYTIKSSFASGAYLVMIAAILVPVLSGFTQWLSIKLAPTAANDQKSSDQGDSMAQQMKMMNTMMPLLSVWIGFSFPIGLGIYWIANAVIRSIVQVIMNKKIDSIDFNDLINQNKEKSQKKLEKMKAQQEKFSAYANVNTRNIQSKASYVNPVTESKSDDDTSSQTSSSQTTAAPGSMAAKANMVRAYNERNNKQ
ncbi:MAG: YidC/Oxa1 family membrane protein insertase [Lachnospiraceae bacterium]|nr:YidC/Oxa1 family membrane protein insertase [Lachnospiraceae bacterium]